MWLVKIKQIKSFDEGWINVSKLAKNLNFERYSRLYVSIYIKRKLFGYKSNDKYLRQSKTTLLSEVLNQVVDIAVVPKFIRILLKISSFDLGHYKRMYRTEIKLA